MRLKKPGLVLQNIIEQVKPELQLISDLESKVKRGNRWSKREIMGHMIDSASINHQRFLRAQLKESLIFDPYDQDLWVEMQKYQDVTWRNLVILWAQYNIQIAPLVNQIPRDQMSNYRHEHNLDQVGWKAVSTSKPTTLKYFIWDYIAHLEHHLRKVMPSYQPVVIDNY